MSVINSNDLSVRLKNILSMNSPPNRESSVDSPHTDKTFKFTDITDMYLESSNPNKLLSFTSSHKSSASGNSVIVKTTDNDYD
jgi:hypothetical protein